MTFIRLIITLPFLILLVLFALSNSTPVRMTLWPTDFLLELPLSIAVLAGMAIAFLLGALFVWIGTLAQRRRALTARQVSVPSLPPPG